MIVGIGTDICEIARIEKLLSKRNLFLDKTFTEQEQQRIQQIKNPAQHIAGRWAAKEAIAKMLGTGFGEHCHWLEIEINNDDLGAPLVSLSKSTKQTAETRNISKIHLSISHEKNYATAVAIGENETN